MLYLNQTSADRLPLSTILRQYLIAGSSSQGESGVGVIGTPPEKLIASLVVIAVIPIAAAFPFLQRFFTKGVLTGAVKS